MKAFISWSGDLSRQIAEILYCELPAILPNFEFFISTEICKGKRWEQEIFRRLSESTIGIICVTPDNLNNQWLNFEAGSLSRELEHRRLTNLVCPILFGFSELSVNGPLSCFQITVYNKIDFKKLIHSLDQASQSNNNPQNIAEPSFDKWWITFRMHINGLLLKHDLPIQPDTISNYTKHLIENKKRDIGLLLAWVLLICFIILFYGSFIKFYFGLPEPKETYRRTQGTLQSIECKNIPEWRTLWGSRAERLLAPADILTSYTYSVDNKDYHGTTFSDCSVQLQKVKDFSYDVNSAVTVYYIENDPNQSYLVSKYDDNRMTTNFFVFLVLPLFAGLFAVQKISSELITVVKRIRPKYSV